MKTRATKTTPTTGRVYIRGQAVGLWWRCEGGGVAGKCGPLGDFAAESPEALAGLVEAAEKERLRLVRTARPTRRRPTRNNQEQDRPVKTDRFARLALALALALRGWPPALVLSVFQGFGPSALLMASASGLPPAVALFLLAGGEPEQAANFMHNNSSKNNCIQGKIGGYESGYKQKPK